ncbi:unnamed protein product [Symbiodinium natans]|uniref:Uncharacterized protein n=1 Tax=Symbiodinium natans TaxID=878477 RepID=A0A812N431_9DINO|nr:unnamed protein product [Symbiodinium natans]
MILAFIEKVLLQGFRTITVPRAKSAPQELFRTDAKAEGSEMWLGGWACSDASTPWECRWFAEKVQHTDAPWFYQAGQSYRSIAALELLSTLVAVHLFAPLQPTSATFTCSAATDNRGNSFLTSRWLTTSFPLCVVLMDLAAVLQSKSLMLDLHWAPRFQNTVADSLTNQDFKDFDPSKRVRFDVSQYRGLVLRELLESGAELYTERSLHLGRSERVAFCHRRNQRQRSWLQPTRGNDVRCCSSFLRKGGRVQVASCNLFVCGGMSRTAAPFSHNCTFCDSRQKWSVRVPLLVTDSHDSHVLGTFCWVGFWFFLGFLVAR